MESRLNFPANRAQFVVLTLAALLFLFGLARIGAVNTYTSDNFIKYLQAASLAKAHFQSEELFYPGRAFDPEFKAFPFDYPYLLRSAKGEHIGTYPLLFSAIMAGPVSVLPPGAIPFLCLGLALITLIVFWRLFSPGAVTLAYAAFCTPLVLLGMEISEHPLLLLSGLFGLFFFIRSLDSNKARHTLLAGFFCMVGVWLRLESLLYTISLFGAWVLVTWRHPPLKKYALFAAASGLVLVAFLVFNFLHYNHLLGPRFLSNPSNPGNLSGHFFRFVSLAFGGQFKLGQFGYSPLLLLPIVYFLVRKTTDIVIRVLVIFEVVFIIAAALLAPNDGIANWGSRYLFLSLYPGLLLLDRFYRDQVQDGNRFRRTSFFAVCAYSVLITLIGFLIQKRAASELRVFQTELEQAQGDVVLFPSQLLASYSGQYYFKKPILVLRKPESVPDLVRAIQGRAPLRISLVEYTGWTANLATRELEFEFGKDRIPLYLKSMETFERTDSKKLGRLTLHEFKTK